MRISFQLNLSACWVERASMKWARLHRLCGLRSNYQEEKQNPMQEKRKRHERKKNNFMAITHQEEEEEHHH